MAVIVPSSTPRSVAFSRPPSWLSVSSRCRFVALSMTRRSCGVFFPHPADVRDILLHVLLHVGDESAAGGRFDIVLQLETPSFASGKLLFQGLAGLFPVEQPVGDLPENELPLAHFHPFDESPRKPPIL